MEWETGGAVPRVTLPHARGHESVLPRHVTEADSE